MDNEENLEEEINDLSNRKGHVLSEEAMIAKQHFDFLKEDLDDDDNDDMDTTNRQVSELTLFNENVKILLSVFYRSQFDEFVYLLANPQKVYISNFLMGVVRGMGFLLGVLFLGLLFLSFIKEGAWAILMK